MCNEIPFRVGKIFASDRNPLGSIWALTILNCLATNVRGKSVTRFLTDVLSTTLQCDYRIKSYVQLKHISVMVGIKLLLTPGRVILNTSIGVSVCFGRHKN